MAKRGRFPGKPCILCGGKSVGVGEHIISSWYIKKFAESMPDFKCFKPMRDNQPYLQRDGHSEVTWKTLPGTHAPMCGDCNSKLNQKIEISAKPVICRLVDCGLGHGNWPILTAAESRAVALWLMKVAILESHPDAENDVHQVKCDLSKTKTEFNDQWLDWLRGDELPSDDFSVFVTRTTIKGDLPVNDAKAMLLPGSIRIRGLDDYQFRDWVIGLPGLNATVVYHPGWPIRHPQVELGSAVELLSGEDCDLGVLPELSLREFRFFPYCDPITFSTTQEYTQLAETHPLEIGIIPGRCNSPNKK